MLNAIKLSSREIEALTWAAQGKTYHEIGLIMGVSFGTIKTHLDTARFKLGAVNLTHAVAIAITYGHIFMTEEAKVKREEFTEELNEQLYGEMVAIRYNLSR
jgi:DNA-binding CsgD family transcriptional regulator